MDSLARRAVFLYTLLMCIVDLFSRWLNRDRQDNVVPAVLPKLEERLHEKLRRDAERDKQIASLREAVAQLAKAQAQTAAALDSITRNDQQPSTPQPRAEVGAGLQQRMLEIVRNGEKALQDFNTAYYDAERRKREIASYYERRRLQRMTRGDA